MRILQLGDTHLGFACRTWGGPPGWDRSLDFLHAAKTLLVPALRGDVDLVIHTGDVFDRSRPPLAAIQSARDLLEHVTACVPVVVVRGNHDRRGLRSTLGPSRKNLHIVNETGVVDVCGLRLGLVSHRRTAAEWARDAQDVARGGVDMMVCHQGVSGARVPGFTFRPGRPPETLGPSHIPAGVRHILSGHIHPRQVVQVGDARVVYAGSSERTSVSEAAQVKGAALWSWGPSPSVRFVDGPSRRLVRVAKTQDIGRVREGDLVSMPARLLRTLGPDVEMRGGIVRLPRSGPSLRRRQLRLFG